MMPDNGKHIPNPYSSATFHLSCSIWGYFEFSIFLYTARGEVWRVLECWRSTYIVTGSYKSCRVNFQFPYTAPMSDGKACTERAPWRLGVKPPLAIISCSLAGKFNKSPTILLKPLFALEPILGIINLTKFLLFFMSWVLTVSQHIKNVWFTVAQLLKLLLVNLKTNLIEDSFEDKLQIEYSLWRQSSHWRFWWR